MNEEVPARRNFTAIDVALISVLPAGATLYWTTRHDPQHDTCAIAASYVGNDKIGPDISPADRIKLSSAMVHRVLECVR